MSKKRLVSGITATGKLTIGNYLGAIKSMVALQDEYEMFIFVADLHALTIDIQPEELRKNKNDIFALFLACGINPNKATIFFQSDVLEHGVMNWIMENMTTIGQLNRMTQFKDKSQKQKEKNGTEKIKTGLLTYPALMSGDILLYNPDIVPVGSDQKQHIELTRDIAIRFNNKYEKIFNIPEIYKNINGQRIMSLSDPSKKMSKSDPIEKSFISLLDDPDKACKKIMKAVTDSENKIKYCDDQPGLKNLINIYSSITDMSIDQIIEKHNGDDNYGNIKKEISNVVKSLLIDIQEKYKKSINEVDKYSQLGAAKAKEVAQVTLKKIMINIGL